MSTQQFWKDKNIKGYKVFFTDNSSFSIQGPSISPDNISSRLTSPWNLKTISHLEEYTYADTIKWDIESKQQQIEICQQHIKTLESDLKEIDNVS